VVSRFSLSTWSIPSVEIAKEKHLNTIINNLNPSKPILENYLSSGQYLPIEIKKLLVISTVVILMFV